MEIVKSLHTKTPHLSNNSVRSCISSVEVPPELQGRPAVILTSSNQKPVLFCVFRWRTLCRCKAILKGNHLTLKRTAFESVRSYVAMHCDLPSEIQQYLQCKIMLACHAVILTVTSAFPFTTCPVTMSAFSIPPLSDTPRPTHPRVFTRTPMERFWLDGSKDQYNSYALLLNTNELLYFASRTVWVSHTATLTTQLKTSRNDGSIFQLLSVTYQVS